MGVARPQQQVNREQSECKPDAAPDWRELSTLYDAAEALPDAERAAWLARLQASGHAQWPHLRKMFEAGDDFLAQLPRFADDGPAAVGQRVGDRIGDYRLLQPLGEGGMAEVWLAERCDGAFERQVALKLLFAPPGAARRQSFRQRFEREHRILATLRHPQIAALHDAGVTPQGQHWLALECVAGQPIDAWCDAQRLGLRARVALFAQVLQAVAHAHARLVLHRDLKPSNVMVTAQGEVRLLDFGIATLLPPDGSASDAGELTRAGGRPLTPRYASPEQLLGTPLSVTSDVYSLGVMLYELLCGAAPFSTDRPGTGALERAILAGDPPPPSRQPVNAAALAARGLTARALRRQLSGELDAIVLRAMARRSEQRYGSADALSADLAHWLAGEPVQARLPGAAARVGKFIRRHPLGSGLGSAAVLALGVATASAVLNARQAEADAARARAASGFMQRLFADADPDRHGGTALTPQQLLVRGRDRLAASGPEPALLQAELLEGIARAQTDMPDFAQAEVTYARWVELCQRQCDAARLAWALTLRAENAHRRQRPDEAAHWLAQADLTQPDAAASPTLRAKRGEVRGWVANADERLADADRAFAQGLAALPAAERTATLQATFLWLGVAQNAAERGAAERALAALDAAAAGAGAVLAERPGLRHDIAMIRAVVFDNLGYYARLQAEVPADLARCVRELGGQSEICRKMQRRLWRALLRLGHEAQARADWPALMQSALTDTPGTTEPERIDALLVAQRLAWPGGDAAAQAQVRPALQALARDGVQPLTRVRATLALADAALHEGRPADALQQVALARQHAGSAGPADAYLAAQIDLLEGLARRADGQAAPALAALAQAQAGFDGVLGAVHPLALWFGLNRALPLWEAGRAGEARALVAAALPVLRRSLGDTAPAFQRVKALAQAVAEAPPAAGRRLPARHDMFG